MLKTVHPSTLLRMNGRLLIMFDPCMVSLSNHRSPRTNSCSCYVFVLVRISRPRSTDTTPRNARLASEVSVISRQGNFCTGPLVSYFRSSLNNSVSLHRHYGKTDNPALLVLPGFRLALAIASLAGMRIFAIPLEL